MAPLYFFLIYLKKNPKIRKINIYIYIGVLMAGRKASGLVRPAEGQLEFCVVTTILDPFVYVKAQRQVTI